ncbi:MAG: RES domain-containing protein [Pseudonocardiaceae bacterium]
MPPTEPPATLTAAPALQVVPRGTRLWRIHSAQIGAEKFLTGGGGIEPDGRFDGDYPAMYVSFHQTTAVAERFLRNRNFTSAGMRTLHRKKLAATVASVVETTTELTLLRLVSEKDFIALHQSDEWLVSAEERDYPLTRRWANRLRDQAAKTHGIVWPSAPDMPRHTAVLFGDRCPVGSLRAPAESAVELDDAAGAHWLTETLRHYRVRVSTPDPADRPLIFLNYRSSDDTAIVEALDRELTSRLGEPAVFRDHRSISPGTYYAADLLQKAKRCRVMLVLIGPRWEEIHGHRMLNDEGDWVRREIVAALTHRVRVVPVLVGARAMLKCDDLPEDIHRLAGLQILALQHHYTDRDVVALVDKLFAAVPLLATSHTDHLRRIASQQ